MKKKKIFLILLIISIMVYVGAKTYSYYFVNMKVSVSSTGSNSMCYASVSEVPTSEKSKLGYSEVKITVKNYDSSDNVSKEPFEYILSITNQDGSNGVFGFNDIFATPLEIYGTLSGESKDEKEYIIQVKSASGLSETVNYNVNVKCTQTN